MVEAVLFDVDGTLIDSVEQHARAWLWAFARHGHDIPLNDIRRQIGKGGDQLMPAFLSPEEISHIGSTLEAERLTFFRDEYLPLLHPFPMVRDLVERVKLDGKRVAIASGARAEELDRYLKIANLADLVDQTISADDVERTRPEADSIVVALERLGSTDPNRVIHVGDTPWDALAARKAGVRSIGLECGGWDRADLKEAGCTEIFASPADLLARYEESILSV